MAKKIVEIISYYDYDIDGSRLFNDVIRESSNLLDGFKWIAEALEYEDANAGLYVFIPLRYSGNVRVFNIIEE